MDESGLRLKIFLFSENIKQNWLAEQLKVKPQYINRICAGRANVSKKLAERLQDLIGINSAWLLTGKGLRKAEQLPTGVDKAHDDSTYSEPSVVVPQENIYGAANKQKGADLASLLQSALDLNKKLTEELAKAQSLNTELQTVITTLKSQII